MRKRTEKKKPPAAKASADETKNVRIYELAKQYDITSKELIEELRRYGIAVKNHMSSLDGETVALIEAERKGAESPKSKTPKEKKARGPKRSRDKPAESVVESKQPETDASGRLQIKENVTVGELASTLGFRPPEMIMRLMKLGIMANVNQRLGYEALQAIGDTFDFDAIRELTLAEKLLVDEEDDPSDLVPRAPVTTIMGHVDHGKTSLLDAIRESNVMESEAGNITQHIGAYNVNLETGNVVFLDTPGHAAFTAMRARGAQVTDVVVLVVAADDGVMPQTIEAINHAKAADVPIVVAINKIDADGARIDYVKEQLGHQNLIPEEWGGQTVFVEISAKERIGIDFLLEMLLLEAELLELTANPRGPARGTVVEAKLDKGRGPVSTVLMQNGTLKVGDAFVAGRYYGRVRAMMDDLGHRLKEAGPATPVEVLGFTGVPEAGDRFYSVESERDARAISDSRQEEHRQTQLGSHSHVSLEDLFQHIQEGEIKELNIIVKGDVQGSVQAVSGELDKLSTAEVKINVIHQAVGGITEPDILLASASNAIVVGFNVHPTTGAVQLKETEEIDVRTYNVIYDLTSDVQSAMEGLLDPEVREVVIGRAIVRDLFKVPRMGTAAGSYVNWGRVSHNQPVRVLRDNRLVYDGKVDSLRRFKENVNEVQANYECGIGINDFSDFKVNDVLECYVYEHVRRTLK
ncbi:MAG: translation initiation factor IF-2 [Candidatus Poribacteria bacterium]|nr:translation initiation factor IF-2 [Candidatus Poribacteria bacterium]